MKVHNLSNPKGLMVNVPIDEWHIGMRELIKNALRKGITPTVVSFVRLDESTETPTLSIILWGDK